MATRRAMKDKQPLSEGEIEAISATLAQREARMQDEAAAFIKQREEFDREREKFDRERDEKSHTISQLEATVAALRTEVMREINQVRANVTTDFQHSEREPHSFEYQRDQVLHREHRRRESPQRTPEGPKVSFREVTESIPTFDGYNIPLSQFARACKRARDIVPPSSEYHLTKILINKLRGRAYYAVEDEPCDTIIQLIDLLNGAFGSAKTIDQYRGELSACYLKPGEHILDFISRVKELRTAIMDAERRTRGILSPELARDIDELSARSFCDGLPLQYRLQMRAEHYTRPMEAFSAAKTLAKREELDRQRNSRAAPTQRTDMTSRGSGYRPSDGYRPPAQRYNREAPPPRTAMSGQRALPPPRDTRAFEQPRSLAVRPARNNDIWCRYCKTPGHEIQECRKRAYNNSMNQRQGNFPGPSTRQDPSRAGPQSSQPIRSIEMTPEEPSESELSA